VVTGAGDLPADWVIHAVGPVYRDGERGEPELLASCYQAALRLAEEKGASRVTAPSISTGVYGYPMTDAAQVAIATVIDWLRRPECRLEHVTFVLFDEQALSAHLRAAEKLLR
jgi:O-acetyl-ADP-ribose deacetylase (regulator of RNase III)